MEFLRQTIGQPASPTFFQFVSHRIFKELVKAKHQLPESVEDQLAESVEDQLEDQASPITKDDENVLRYVSKFRQKSSHLLFHSRRRWCCLFLI